MLHLTLPFNHTFNYTLIIPFYQFVNSIDRFIKSCKKPLTFMLNLEFGSVTLLLLMSIFWSVGWSVDRFVDR